MAKVAMTEAGMAREAMIVEDQEPRKKKNYKNGQGTSQKKGFKKLPVVSGDKTG